MESILCIILAVIVTLLLTLILTLAGIIKEWVLRKKNK